MMLTCILISGSFWLEAVRTDDTRVFMRPEEVIALSVVERLRQDETRIRLTSNNDFYVHMEIREAFDVVSTCKNTPIPD